MELINEDILREIFLWVITKPALYTSGRWSLANAPSIMSASRHWNNAFKKFIRRGLFNETIDFSVFDKGRSLNLAVALLKIHGQYLILKRSRQNSRDLTITMELINNEYWIVERLEKIAIFLNWNHRIPDEERFSLKSHQRCEINMYLTISKN
jgi:hypothetical protein